MGVAQIISWGTLYYSLAVLAAPIKAELGFSDVMVFGAFTLGQLLSGVLSPYVGARIDQVGGRNVMTSGSMVAACALLLVAFAREPIVFILGWVLAGAAMTACLYDPAFATLHQIAPDRYRRAVTGLTLFGGFASTVFWPLSHALATQLDWRATLVIFAVLHVLVCAPIHQFAIPRGANQQVLQPSGPRQAPHIGAADRRFAWLAGSFASATLVFSAMSAFLISALNVRGFTVEQAVWLGALIGPMQVLARLIEWSVAGRMCAIGVGYAACVLGLAAMLLLNVIPGVIGFGVLFALCYGASNGILTIARGTVPAEMFGATQQGAILGRLARPSFFAKALAPGLFAMALSQGVSMHACIALLAAISATGLFCFWRAARVPLRNRMTEELV